MNRRIWWYAKSLNSNKGSTDCQIFLLIMLLGLDGSWIPIPNNILIDIIECNIVDSVIGSWRLFIIIIHKRDCFFIQIFHLDKITLKCFFKKVSYWKVILKFELRSLAYTGFDIPQDEDVYPGSPGQPAGCEGQVAWSGHSWTLSGCGGREHYCILYLKQMLIHFT